MDPPRNLPYLEILSHPAAHPAKRPPLLFIHGGFHAAWCWDEHFLPWFAGHGWDAHAVSLRGHGGSGPRGRLNRWRLQDYVEDARRAAEQLKRPPVLIGHSLGGHVAMRLAPRIDAPAVALLAPSPTYGTEQVRARMLRRHPVAMTLAFATGNLCLAKRAFASFFFRESLPPDVRRRYIARLDCESMAAVQDVLGARDPADPCAVTSPSMVIGGADDWSIPQAILQDTADRLRAPFRVTPGAHDLMLDPAWETTAEVLHGWLLDTCGSGGS
ncbi:MAG: alpha/beta hydrolase [Gammaproteobacteria bacterium]